MDFISISDQIMRWLAMPETALIACIVLASPFAISGDSIFFCGLMPTGTESNVNFSGAKGIDKGPQYADIYHGRQQKSLFVRKGYIYGSTEANF